MAQAYFSLVTNTGKIKLAQSAAGGAAVVISSFAIGDGNGAETSPTAASTALVREVWRTPVESVITDPDNPAAILVTAIIPTSAGGWWMREFGIFDQAGAMIAVAKPVSQYKPTAAEGQLEDIRYEFQIVIGENANVTLVVDPTLLLASRAWVQNRVIPLAQLARLPWIPVVSMTTTAPPANPTQGNAWLVPSNATGVWAANAGKIAEWLGTEWLYSMPVDGHAISLPDGRVFQRVDGSYSELLASATRSGLVKLATSAEVQAGTDTAKAITPAGLSARTATDTRTGIVELATVAEVQAGTDTGRAVTPAGLVSRTATETRTGIVELATVAEATTGTDTSRAVTPAGLTAAVTAAIANVINGSPAALDTLYELAEALGNDANFAVTMTNALAEKVDISRTATDARTGIVELATNAETQAGTDATRAVTPAGLASRTSTESRTGVIEIATSAEVATGTDTTRAVTPIRLKERTNALTASTQANAWNYAVAAGTANALTAALDPAPAALVDGMVVDLAIANENTGAATLNLNGLGAAPIRTMASAPLQRGDLQAGAVMRLIYSAGAWLLGGGLARSEVPLVPIADVILYVRTDGNDNNDGGANTAARAFKTIQAAIDNVTARYSASASFGVRIILGNAGTYAAARNDRYPGTISIEGGGGTYIITGGDVGIGAPCAFATRTGRVTLKNLTLRNTATSGFAVSAAALGGYLFLDTVSITSALNNGNYVPLYITEGGVLSISTQLVLNGGDGTTRTMRALMQVGTGGVFNGAPSAATIYIATSSWVAGMVEAQMSGVAIFANITLSPSGSFSGPRYSVYANGVINTYGGGDNFFPGNSSGSASSGGQYL